MARPTGRPIRDELITSATALIQQVGVTGFSYGVLAKELNIKAPSIHHHFPSKDDLVTAVASGYRKDFAAAADALDAETPLDRIAAYAELFAHAARTDKLCLCGAVSADWVTVGEKARHEVHLFFEEQLAWLEKELQQGVDANTLRLEVPVSTLAATILAALEGSMLISRANGDVNLPVDITALLRTLIQAPQAS